MEGKGVKVNTNKTKIMVSRGRLKEVNNIGRWTYGVCGRGVGRNMIQCTTNCQKWVHKKCNGIKGGMLKACGGCADQPVI